MLFVIEALLRTLCKTKHSKASLKPFRTNPDPNNSLKIQIDPIEYIKDRISTSALIPSAARA